MAWSSPRDLAHRGCRDPFAWQCNRPQPPWQVSALVDLHGVRGQPGPHRGHGGHLRPRIGHTVSKPPPYRGRVRWHLGGWNPSAAGTLGAGRGRLHRQDVDCTNPNARFVAAPAGQAPARSSARLRLVVDLRVRRGHPGGTRHRNRVWVRDRPRGARLVAHEPGRALLQQPAPVERRAVHGVHGDPPVGQVLDGRLARSPSADLDHRRGGLRRIGGRMLHRLSLPTELRLSVDLDQREGRHQRGRPRSVLQLDELRPDAALARRADPDCARGNRRGTHPARPSPGRLAPSPFPSKPAVVRRVGRPQRPTPRSGAVPLGATTS